MLLRALSVGLPLLAISCGQTATRATQNRIYPYHEATFTNFVKESYEVAGKGTPDEFFKWMDDEFKKSTGTNVDGWIKAHSAALKGNAADQMKAAAALHKAIKATIKKFSLDRGFEFCNVVSNCERQCYLQSVLIASILQKGGMTAGVAMVNRNMTGGYSVNGHAVCLATLNDGTDIVVDASEPMPFPNHQGLFVTSLARNTYQYVEPKYRTNGQIDSFKVIGGTGSLRPSQVATLDIPFLESQFDYYRGERVPNGIIVSNPKKEALEASAKFFEKSQTECPSNPLNVYMLGRTYQKLGLDKQAQEQYATAAALFRKFGWLPSGLKDAMRK